LQRIDFWLQRVTFTATALALMQLMLLLLPPPQMLLLRSCRRG